MSKKYFQDLKLENLVKWLLFILATVAVSFYFTSNYLIDSSLVEYQIVQYKQILQIGVCLSTIVISTLIHSYIDKNFILKLVVSYLLYLCVSYSLLFTQNINNENFYIFAFQKNRLMELSGLIYIVVLIIAAGIIRIIFKRLAIKENINSLFQLKGETSLILSLLVSLIVIRDSKLLDNLKQFLFLTDIVDFPNFLINLSYKLPLIIITTSVLVYTFWKSVEGIRENNSTVALAITSSFVFALLFNFTIQFGIRIKEPFLGKYIFPGATLFQIFFLALFFLVLYFITNRYWLATSFILFSGVALSIANSLKFISRSEPLLVTDFSMLSQLDLVFSFLDVKVFIAAMGLLIVSVASYLYLRKRYLKGKIFDNFWKRMLLTVSTLAMLGSIFTFFYQRERGVVIKNVPVLTRLTSGMNIAFEGHARNARYNSLMYVWMKQVTKPIILEPEGYSRETIEKIVEKYQNRALEINKTRTQDISDETLIFILSESFGDPSRIEEVTLSENVLNNINSISEKTTSGLMKSNNFGGGTANMESQALTGLPMYNLSPSVSIYNVEVIPNMAIVPSISDLFSEQDRMMIHLGNIKLYSRAAVYNKMNFTEMIADDEDATAPTKNEKYGQFPSDESTYQNVLDKLDVDKNQFFSVITFQNHMPWAMSEPANITGTGEGFTEGENNSLSNFARLLKKTDEDTEEFLKKLSSLDKKITVVFYGDHLPSFYPESIFADKPDSQYLTDYFIWSNHGNKKLNLPLINSSDFPAAVLAHTNSKVSPYYALLTDVLEHASVDKKNLTDEQQIIADDLKMVEYDLISGKFYLEKYKQFFTIE
ncbi:LTA synthase family protein [Streptococcus suis]